MQQHISRENVKFYSDAIFSGRVLRERHRETQTRDDWTTRGRRYVDHTCASCKRNILFVVPHHVARSYSLLLVYSSLIPPLARDSRSRKILLPRRNEKERCTHGIFFAEKDITSYNARVLRIPVELKLRRNEVFPDSPPRKTRFSCFRSVDARTCGNRARVLVFRTDRGKSTIISNMHVTLYDTHRYSVSLEKFIRIALGVR